MTSSFSASPCDRYLRQAGIYGFDDIESIILASLITGDPLLLIGKAGTGKTFLLNSISQLLRLNHKHYNASYLSFDDLIGFPYPSADGKRINFIPTPATIWDAESILIDELSRCKPEIQNKFFSIIQEKKIQGIPLEKLRYRWAAMNPIAFNIAEEEDHYEGSISLDQALADRFAFIVEVPDWGDMTLNEQENIIHPDHVNKLEDISISLSQRISELHIKFDLLIQQPSYELISYCKAVTTLMADAGYRLSPRRARMLVRNFTALFLVMSENESENSEKDRSRIYKHGLKWSLPQRAYKNMKDAGHVIDAVHQAAVTMAFESRSDDRWLHEFELSNGLRRKIEMLVGNKASIEQKSIATIQFLHTASLKDKAIFAFTTQPFFKARGILNKEALDELTAIATKLMLVNGTLEWTDSNPAKTIHPRWSECAKYLAAMPVAEEQRKRRTKQLFLFLVLEGKESIDPATVEQELNICFTKIQSHAGAVFA
jgi:MoxR-like ATPase